MPEAVQPPLILPGDIDAPWTPFKFEGDRVSTAYAAELVDKTLFRWENWRSINHDPRWRLNEWLYYGYVPTRVWDGTNIPRSSIPWQIAFEQVEAAYIKLYRELLSTDEIVQAIPEGQTHPIEAQQIRDRLNYIFDHNIDDEGWTARMELKLCLKDLLIYGNCFAMAEWDEERRQGTVFRVDPRDVYIDPASTGPYLGTSRARIVRRALTIDEIESMRGYKDFHVPPPSVLLALAQHREVTIGDRSKTIQESARGVRYQPVSDDYVALPASRLIDMYVYSGGGREIWQLGRGNGSSFILYNEPYTYGNCRLVSAPCFTVPNRFYAQSYVDILDPLQQLGTALINRHLDELALAMNPPRATKQGVLRTPSQQAWRPGQVNEYADPKNDQIVWQAQGITGQVWQTMDWAKGEAEARTGQSSLFSSGQPSRGNADRTRGGMQMQLQAPMERISEVADNFEQYLLIPLCYKLLRIEKKHSAEGQSIYGKRPVPTF